MCNTELELRGAFVSDFVWEKRKKIQVCLKLVAAIIGAQSGTMYITRIISALA